MPQWFGRLPMDSEILGSRLIKVDPGSLWFNLSAALLKSRLVF